MHLKSVPWWIIWCKNHGNWEIFWPSVVGVKTKKNTHTHLITGMTTPWIDHCSVYFCLWNIIPFLNWPSALTLAGGLGRNLNRLSRLSQACSMVLWSGLLFVLRKFTVSLAVWEVALSWWKIETWSIGSNPASWHFVIYTLNEVLPIIHKMCMWRYMISTCFCLRLERVLLFHIYLLKGYLVPVQPPCNLSCELVSCWLFSVIIGSLWTSTS